jgi:hypothetical protein
MQAQAILFLASSIFYIFGRFMRTVFRPVGNILTGLFGQLILFILWLITLFLCLLGSFWLYIANLHRTEDNSSIEGDPNYCAPVIWNLSIVAIYLFWIFSGITIIATVSQIYYSVLGPEYEYQRTVHVPSKK